MKKFLSIITLFVLMLGSLAKAESVEQRLTNIENRLKNIEQSLEGFDKLISIFEDPNANLSDLFNANSDTKANTTSSNNNSKIDLETRKLYCEKEDFSTKIYFNYLLYNNYDKGVKYVDASIKVKDLFGETLLTATILKNAQVGPNTNRFFKSSMDDTFSDSCTKLKQAEFEDYKYEFSVSKIAFEDNTVLEFN